MSTPPLNNRQMSRDGSVRGWRKTWRTKFLGAYISPGSGCVGKQKISRVCRTRFAMPPIIFCRGIPLGRFEYFFTPVFKSFFDQKLDLVIGLGDSNRRSRSRNGPVLLDRSDSRARNSRSNINMRPSLELGLVPADKLDLIPAPPPPPAHVNSWRKIWRTKFSGT